MFGYVFEFQLNIQLHNTSFDVFRGYTEGIILFQPTYKYDPGSDIYDTRLVTGNKQCLYERHTHHIFINNFDGSMFNVKSTVSP